jgi:hypothetical protein
MDKKNPDSKQSLETGADKKETRRKVLRNTLIGGAVISTGAAIPGKWSKPALEAVILPSHAATTDDTGTDPGENTTTAAPTTTATPTTTTGKPNVNSTSAFNFSSWTDEIV